MGIAALLILAAGVQPQGACARCHISTTVEWNISKHRSAGVTCVTCHGPSEGHVVEERNHVKPGRVPQGAAISAFCRECHQNQKPTACQTCHHVHALLDPRRKPEEIANPRAKPDTRYLDAMKSGEARIAQALHPEMPGFRRLNERFDPATGLPAEVEIPGLGLRMLAVAGGSFDMGDDALADSRPVHTVRVGAFYLGQYEVTQEQWEKVMGSNPSFHRGARMPVENVSWDDCQAFLDRLNRQVEGGGLRLPSEAEWEFAARALGGAAWYRGNSQVRQTPRPDYPDLAPRPVGSQAPNALGFYDLRGNVWEWCSSSLSPYLREGSGGLRVLRGGSYADDEANLNPAFRHGERPNRRFRWNGLRLARDTAVR